MRQYVTVGFVLLDFGQTPCGDPDERIPPEQGPDALHDDPLGGVTVADMAQFVGDDGRHVAFGNRIVQIDRAEERERGDVGLRQYDVAVGAADRPCAVPETADPHDLGDHRAEREQHAEGVQEGGQEHEQRLPDGIGCHIECFACPDGNAERRDEGGQQHRADQIEPAVEERRPVFEQHRVGQQQCRAAYENFECVDQQFFHGVSVFCRSVA